MNKQDAINDALITQGLISRFMKYVRYWTTSSSRVEETPSSPGQWDLAKVLVQELQELGLEDLVLTEHCYVIARIPASPGREDSPALGFMAHLDTAEDVSGKDVKPCLVEVYDGKKISLANGFALDPELDADLAAQKGKAIIHADGTTLLGADDKAGIAELMGAADYLVKHPEFEHNPVELIFTPDEETGKGLPDFPRDRIRALYCYTVDGGALGEIEAECFNAYRADIQFTGKARHLGYARGLMANAALMAATFATMLPRSESPEATDGYYGYYCPMNITGTPESASLEVFIRDFDQAGAKRRLAGLDCFARAVEAQFPGGTVSVVSRPQYYNMKEKIDAQPEVLDRLWRAVCALGVEPRLKPIRGGTDGSRLTELGIPTPNIFTGGRNWHSRLEWVSVPDMLAACKVILLLLNASSQGGAK
jgi:tripeptide aminopeptidase